MKIVEIQPVMEIIEYIEMEDGSYYKRYESGIWEQLMGQSWETCYSDEDQLEELYRKTTGK